MKQVIRIGEEPKEEKELKPIEFTHYFSDSGRKKAENKPNYFNKIVYLGKCDSDGELFAAYINDFITIYKGHLNDGVY